MVVALIGAFREKPWSMPSSLFANIFETAQKIISTSTSQDVLSVGWELLSALMIVGPTTVQYHLAGLRELWKKTLEGKVRYK